MNKLNKYMLMVMILTLGLMITDGGAVASRVKGEVKRVESGTAACSLLEQTHSGVGSPGCANLHVVEVVSGTAVHLRAGATVVVKVRGTNRAKAIGKVMGDAGDPLSGNKLDSIILIIKPGHDDARPTLITVDRLPLPVSGDRVTIKAKKAEARVEGC